MKLSRWGGAVKTSNELGGERDDESATGRSRDGARRVLTVLTAFSPERHTQTARDLARATGIPLPSIYRYVALLRDIGLLIGDERGNYHPSARLSVIARAAEKAEPLSDIADPVMRRLSDVTGETAILVRLIARSAVCVHRIESTQSLRTSYAPLAARDADAAARLEEQALIAGERGWAVSEEEIDTGVWAAAAAVRDRTGIMAALSVPSPLVRAPEALQEKLLGQVRSAAEEINASLRAAHR
jgi:DNA-binding IclR family transcriptional regulator